MAAANFVADPLIPIVCLSKGLRKPMPENFALYSCLVDTLPQKQMLVLGDDVKPEISQTDRGRTFTYRWPDLTIIVSEMPSELVAEHLQGFEGYVRQHIYKGKVPARGEQIIRKIRATQIVVGVELQPKRNEQAEELIGRMCGGLRPIMFHADALYDWMCKLLLAPNGSFDPEAELD